MKRCPQCNRVETHDALAFCRADGTVLVTNKDETCAYLNRAYDERSYYLTWLKVDSQMDNLRSDPRFQDLLKRLNLPE